MIRLLAIVSCWKSPRLSPLPPPSPTVLFVHLIVAFLRSGFPTAKNNFFEGNHAGVGCVVEHVFTAVARGGKTRVINQGTEATAAMKTIDEVQNNTYGRFYVRESRCTDFSMKILESILRISQPWYDRTIFIRSCAVDACLALRRSIGRSFSSSTCLTNTLECHLGLVCIVVTFATCFTVTSRSPPGGLPFGHPRVSMD